jgi:hypothetical protein
VIGFNAINPLIGGAGQFQLIQKLMGKGMSMLHDIVKCNAPLFPAGSQPAQTLQTFRTAWEAWQIDSALFHWTNGAGTKIAGGTIPSASVQGLGMLDLYICTFRFIN